MSRRLLVATIAVALAACSPESKIEPLRINSSGTLPQGVLDVQYTFPIELAGGTAPYKFSASIPSDIGWLAVDPDTGVLSGVPDVEQASPIGFVVKVTDANQQSASATLAVKVVFCVENEVRTCTTVGSGSNAGQCMQSEWVCLNDAFPSSCPSSAVLSTDIDACGAACGACDRAKADRCDGDCSCGGGSVCGDATTCCSGACVNTTTDEQNCGACGAVCSAAPAHGTPLCIASGCSFECETGFTKCGDACLDANTDGSNCGTCGNVCQGTNANCDNGQCTATCPEGTTICDGGCYTQAAFQNGDPLHCGSCEHACPAPPAGAQATCTNGSCGVACNAGFGLCNGVCIDLQNDQSNCGSCGHSCGVDAYGWDYYCSAGVCGSRCAAGYFYCRYSDDCLPTGAICRIVIEPPCKLSASGLTTVCP